jgi:hypothetical protein
METLAKATAGQTLTINGSKLRVLRGYGVVVELQGPRGGECTAVQNKKSGRWYLLRSGVETEITTAVAA